MYFYPLCHYTGPWLSLEMNTSKFLNESPRTPQDWSTHEVTFFEKKNLYWFLKLPEMWADVPKVIAELSGEQWVGKCNCRNTLLAKLSTLFLHEDFACVF